MIGDGVNAFFFPLSLHLDFFFLFREWKGLREDN